MGQDFSSAPRGGAGMGLGFLDPPRPARPRPRPAPPLVTKGYNYKFFYILKPYYLNKHINISIFYSTQCDSLSLFCYVLYNEIFIYFFNDCLVKYLDILFNFF